MPLPEIGETLEGKYRIERLIGRGGMGAVFQARHAMLDQLVAIKFLLPEISANASAVARFINEARAAAQIRNDHVARVLDVVQLPNGGAFMVLEYLEGLDLATLVANQGPLTIFDAVGYLLQSLEAIAQAHALGIVHRDFKPANLFLSHRPDGTTCVKVLDFGISKATGQGVSGLTSTNSMLGSPSFMSPEQVRSPKNVDPRSDLWSAGVCLYHLLTGQLPFKGETVGEVFAAILEQTPASVSSINFWVPPELEAVIQRCLQRHPDDRYKDAGELAEALAAFANEADRGAPERIRRILLGSVKIIVPTVPAPATFGVTTPVPGPRVTGASALPIYRRVSSTDLPKQESYQTEKTCAPPSDLAAPQAPPARSLLLDESPTDRSEVRKRPVAEDSPQPPAGAATEPAYPAFVREPLDIAPAKPAEPAEPAAPQAAAPMADPIADTAEEKEEEEEKSEADTEQVQSPFAPAVAPPAPAPAAAEPPAAPAQPVFRNSLEESDEETDVSVEGRPTERALLAEPEPKSKLWLVAALLVAAALAVGGFLFFRS